MFHRALLSTAGYDNHVVANQVCLWASIETGTSTSASYSSCRKPLLTNRVGAAAGSLSPDLARSWTSKGLSLMFGTPVNTATYRQINIGQLRHVLRQYGPASRRFLALPGVGDDDGMVEQQDSYANEVQDVAAGHDTATATAHYAVGDELYYGLSETKDHALDRKSVV